MKIFAVLFLALSLQAQTPLRLRTGGYETMYRITGITMGSPAVVTVKNWKGLLQHELHDGQIIYIHDVPGCQAANGYRKVTGAVPATGVFALTDVTNAPVECAAPFESVWQSGFLGPVEDYTIRSSPRLFIPASGPVKDRLTDPDGDGPLKGTGATSDNPVWNALLSSNASRVSTCCTDVATFRWTNSNAGANQNMLEAFPALNAALVWHADNSRTDYLKLAQYAILNAEMLFQDSSNKMRPGFACDTTASYCGLGSGVDWESFVAANLVMTYDLIKSRLTGEQRQTFRDKMLNGYNGRGCTNQLQLQSGTAVLASTSTTVTGNGFSAFAAGDWVYFKHVRTNGSSGIWRKVASVASDSEMTLDAAPGANAAGADLYKVSPWTSGSCGAIWSTLGHLYFYGQPRGRASLASAVTSPSATTMTVKSTANLVDPAPFFLKIDNEFVRVTAVDGNQLTVERGAQYSTPANHSAGAAVRWSPQVAGITGSTQFASGPFAITGDWRHNLTLMKLYGYLMVGLALADEDPRAREMAEAGWNYYYDLTYAYHRDFWSGSTQGGYNYGYRWGRWQAQLLPIGYAGEYMFDRPNSVFGDYYWRELKSIWMAATPGYWKSFMYDGPRSASQDTVVSMTQVPVWVAAALTFAPGDLSDYGAYWFRNLSGLYTTSALSNGRGLLHMFAHFPPEAMGKDFRVAENPWHFTTENDYDLDSATGSKDNYYGMIYSKSDWSDNATFLYSALGFSDISDHLVADPPGMPGSYGLLKAGRVLIGDDAPYGIGATAGSGPSRSYFELGGSSGVLRTSGELYPAWYSAGSGGQRNRITKKRGTAEYVYAVGDFTQSFNATVNIARAQRSFVHLKGPIEYVFAFDNYATTSGKSTQMRTYLHNYKQDDVGSTYSRTGSDIVFTKPTGKAVRLSTRLLFPDGRQPVITDDSQTGGSVYGYNTTVTWGVTPGAQMIAVHRPALGTSDIMPPTRVLNGDPAFTGVEIDDGDNSRVVLFATDDAPRMLASFTTNFNGLGGCLVTGLSEGHYSVLRNGIMWRENETVSEDGSMYFACSGGSGVTWNVQRVGSPTPVLTVEPLAASLQYTIGGTVPASVQIAASCSPGTCNVSAAAECLWLTVSPGAGVTPQTFTATPNMSELPAGNYSCPVTVTAEGALNSPRLVTVDLKVENPLEPPPPFQVETSWLPNGIAGTEYSFQLVATGGTGPYAWSIVGGGLPDGLWLTPDGVITGTPVGQQITEVILQAQDSSQPAKTASKVLMLAIDVVDSSRFQVQAGISNSNRMQIRYGKPGLPAERTCTVALSNTASFQTVLSTITDTGGLSRRSYRFGDAVSLKARSPHSHRRYGLLCFISKERHQPPCRRSLEQKLIARLTSRRL